MESTIISITEDGRQLTAHGYDSPRRVLEHIAERVRLSKYSKHDTRYVRFVEVRTEGVHTVLYTYDRDGAWLENRQVL